MLSSDKSEDPSFLSLSLSLCFVSSAAQHSRSPRPSLVHSYCVCVLLFLPKPFLMKPFLIGVPFGLGLGLLSIRVFL